MKTLILASLLVATLVACSYTNVPQINPKPVTLKAGSLKWMGNNTNSVLALDARFSSLTGIVKLPAGDYILLNSNQLCRLEAPGMANVHSVTTSGYSLSRMAAASVTSGNKIHVLANLNEVLEVDGTSFAVTFVAGNGSTGTSDGVGGDAYFNTPQALTHSTDEAQVIVADTKNGCIRSVVLSSGTVTTVAGKCGYPGYLDAASGLNARFNNPTSIITVAGVYYTSDRLGRILRLSPGASWATHTVGVTPAGLSGGPLLYDASVSALYMLRGNGLWQVGNLTDDSSTYLVWIPTNMEPSVTATGVLSTVTSDVILMTTNFGVVSVNMASTTGTLAPPLANEYPTQQEYSTALVAGTGFSGSINGNGDVAQFRRAQGMAQLPNGDLVLCDRGNSALKLISSGSGTTWSGVAASTVTVSTMSVTTGPAFNIPTAVLVESATSLFVVDGSQILAYSPTTTTTNSIAGAAASGFLDDPTNGTLARFNNPSALVRFNAGLVVSDTRNYCLRSVDTTTPWGVSTVAGTCGQMGDQDGTAGSAHFSNPVGLVVQTQTSVLYVADSDLIRKVTAGFVVTTVTSLRGHSARAHLSWTTQDSEFLYVYGGAWLSKINLTTPFAREFMYSPVGGQGTDQISESGVGLLAGTNSHEIFLLRNDRILRVDGTVVFTPAPPGSSPVAAPPGPTTTPTGAPDKNYLVYTNLAGTDFAGTGDGVGDAARFAALSLFAVDPTSGLHYVYDLTRRALCTVNSGGVVATLDSTADSSLVDLVFRPDGVAHALSFHSNIYAFTASGPSLNFLAGNSSIGTKDGTGLDAKFNQPRGLIYASTSSTSSNLIVADTGNGCLRGVTVGTGVVDTKAGLCGDLGTADGTSTVARFYEPRAMALAPSMTAFYVMDKSFVRKVASGTFEVSTVATFAVSQHSVSQSWLLQLSWNSNSESLFLAGGAFALMELRNLTASTGDPYLHSYSLAMPQSLSGRGHSLKSVLVRGPKDIDVLFSTKLGSVNLDSVVPVAPTNPASDTPSPVFVATIPTPQPPPGQAAKEAVLKSTNEPSGHVSQFFQDHTTTVVVVGTVVGVVLAVLAVAAFASRLRFRRADSQEDQSDTIEAGSGEVELSSRVTVLQNPLLKAPALEV